MKIYQFVIPAPYQVRGKLQQESTFFVLDSRFHGNNTWDAYIYFLSNWYLK
jgi:hypothetical protein